MCSELLPEVDSDAPALDSLAAVAELERECADAEDACTGPRCEKCDALLASEVVTICRRCGWYASLGTFVEVDAQWETAVAGPTPDEETPQAAPARSWLHCLPGWSWLLIGSVLAVVVESVVARLVTPAESSLRTSWSLGQLGVGVLIVAGCHIFNFIVHAAEDADFGILDLFLKPLKLWIRAVQHLPRRLWLATSAACGLTAVLMSIFVIGGLPYERLWDWGYKAPPKQNLMGAVMNRVKQLESRNGADNLEDAISDFAGSQDLEAKEPPKPPAKPRSTVDCVVLGYDLDREGRLSTLLLGTAHAGQLIYIGRVAPTMPEEELAALQQKLVELKTLQPFIPIEAEATWVRPHLACRISYGERLKGGRLRDLQWDALLGTIDPRRSN